MIKRIIGLLMAAATIAVIVFAVINREKYTSMLGERATQQTAAPATSAPKASAPDTAPQRVSAVDSLAPVE